jgi:hypothetical protein
VVEFCLGHEPIKIVRRRFFTPGFYGSEHFISSYPAHQFAANRFMIERLANLHPPSRQKADEYLLISGYARHRLISQLGGKPG